MSVKCKQVQYRQLSELPASQPSMPRTAILYDVLLHYIAYPILLWCVACRYKVVVVPNIPYRQRIVSQQHNKITIHVLLFAGIASFALPHRNKNYQAFHTLPFCIQRERSRRTNGIPESHSSETKGLILLFHEPSLSKLHSQWRPRRHGLPQQIEMLHFYDDCAVPGAGKPRTHLQNK